MKNRSTPLLCLLAALYGLQLHAAPKTDKPKNPRAKGNPFLLPSAPLSSPEALSAPFPGANQPPSMDPRSFVRCPIGYSFGVMPDSSKWCVQCGAGFNFNQSAWKCERSVFAQITQNPAVTTPITSITTGAIQCQTGDSMVGSLGQGFACVKISEDGNACGTRGVLNFQTDRCRYQITLHQTNSLADFARDGNFQPVAAARKQFYCPNATQLLVMTDGADRPSKMTCAQGDGSGGSWYHLPRERANEDPGILGSRAHTDGTRLCGSTNIQDSKNNQIRAHGKAVVYLGSGFTALNPGYHPGFVNQSFSCAILHEEQSDPICNGSSNFYYDSTLNSCAKREYYAPNGYPGTAIVGTNGPPTYLACPADSTMGSLTTTWQLKGNASGRWAYCEGKESIDPTATAAP